MIRKFQSEVSVNKQTFMKGVVHALIKNNQINQPPSPNRAKEIAAEGDADRLIQDKNDPNYIDISQKYD